MLKIVTEWPSDRVTEGLSDWVTEWPSDWVTEWQSDRKLCRRLTAWYIYIVLCLYVDLLPQQLRARCLLAGHLCVGGGGWLFSKPLGRGVQADCELWTDKCLFFLSYVLYDLVPECIGKATWRSCPRNIRGGGGAEVANGPAFSWSICKIWSKPKERLSSKKLCYKLNNYTFQFLYYSLKQKALMDPVGNILFAGEYANKVNKHL